MNVKNAEKQWKTEKNKIKVKKEKKMNRTVKKTIAASMAASMLLAGLPQNNNVMSVQAEEKQDVDFIYDDGGVDTEGFFFMKGGKFGIEADENAVLVLMNNDGNKTEIPSVDENGNRVFTQAVKSTSGSYYNMVKLLNENGTAFVQTDGTYFGGEQKYYNYDSVYPVSDYAIMTVTYGTDENGNSQSKYMLITETGKTISFEDGERFDTRIIGDKLLCYRYNENLIYTYAPQTDEIGTIQGIFSMVYSNNNYFTVASKIGGEKELYNTSLEATGIFVPANASVDASALDSEGYAYINTYSNVDSSNIIDMNGNSWNTTEMILRNPQVLDVEEGYYYAMVKQEEKEEYHILSKDNTVDVNVTQALEEKTGFADLTGNYYEFNGDLVVFAKDETASKTSGSVYIFDKDSQYTQIKELENIDYIKLSSEYILTGKKDDNNRYTVQGLYNSQYQKIEISQKDELSFIYANALSNNHWIFELYLYNQGSDSYILLDNNGISSGNYGTVYLDSSKTYLFCSDGGKTKTDIYNRDGELIYSGKYASAGGCNTSLNIWKYWDGSVCIVNQSPSIDYSYKKIEDCDYSVIDFDGKVYFSSDDYRLYDYTMTEKGKFLACVFQENSEGKRKYGAKYIDDIEKTLSSEDNNVVIEYMTGELKVNVSLNTKILSETDKEYTKIPVKGKVFPYEISILDKQQQTVQPDGEVRVKILCPKGYSGEKCKVYYVDDNSGFTDMNVEYEEGYLCFAAKHFSTYLIAETELKTIEELEYGDANNDGQINSKDAVLLKKYLAGFSDIIIYSNAADVNVDNSIDSKDAVRLLRYFAGFDVKLGE